MNSTPHIARQLLSAAILGILTAGAAQGQTTGNTTGQTNPPATQTKKGSTAANSKNATNLDAMVVTGTASNGGVKKLDASYSITTATAQQIREANPKSSADLLKLSPGVFPESSGGQTGANIEVAGFPGGGDAPYVTFQLNGSPLYPLSSLSFFENSSLLRLDDTIDRLEAVQGGPAVLYGNGQPGLIANFILKEGTDTPTGDLGVTWGSEGMGRLDGFVGGKLADDWYGSIGGFWRKSDGVRDPQFAADNGGSLTGTLTHNFGDKGSLMLYARVLKDHNQFVTDTPILNPSTGKFHKYPGFSALTGTFGSHADQRESIEITPCNTAGCTPGTKELNLAKGRGADIHTFGGNLDFDLGDGFSLSDKFDFTGGQMNTIAFGSTGANPETLAQYVAGALSSYGLPSTTGYTATYTSNGAAANPNENVTTQSLWSVHKRLTGETNELHISKELFDGNTLTLGNYTAVYDDHDTWYLGNNMLLQAKNNPSPIAITLSNGDVLSSSQGFVGGPNSIAETWHGFNTAFFLTDSWKVDNWLFDAGVRVEHQRANGRVTNTATGDLDANQATLWNNDSTYLTSGYQAIHYSKSAPSWTIGANYEFNSAMSAYVRINDGVHFPGFDDLRGLPDTPVQKVHNMEIGFKYQSDWLYADISAYRKLFYNVPYTITYGDGSQYSLDYNSATKGINFNTIWKPFKNFSITFSGDYMNGRYTNGQASYTTQEGNTAYANMVHKQLQRQPKFQGRLTPAYDLPTSWGDLKLWVTYEYVGTRYGDLIEEQPLGQYHDLSFGVSANVGEHWEFNLQGTNMTNEIGITEGNSRLFGSANEGGVILARSIEGREVNFQAKYNW